MVGVQKRKIRWAISLFLVMLYFSGLPAQAQYGGGSGEPNDPYLIYTAEQMNAIGAEPNDRDKHFKLMADIDLSAYTGTAFNIIGIDWDNAFTGVFDGNGKKISNFSYTNSAYAFYVGLFGRVHRGVIKNLGLINPNVNAGKGSYVSSLVGYLSREGTITNCYAEGGSVSGEWSVGGLVGYNSTIISNCYATGNIEGGRGVGGLVGYNWKLSHITNCYSTGSVSGVVEVGGLVGINDGQVTGSFWDTQTSGRNNMCGSQDPQGSGCNDANGKTTAEMQMESTFTSAGWDFVGEFENGPSDDWAKPVGGGYPILSWQLSALPELPTFSGGTGAPDDPYLLSTAEDLNRIGHNPRLMAAHFKLTNDIDLAGVEFFIIASRGYRYTGVFDGNGHTISNFSYYTYTDTHNIGLFEYVEGENALIKDLGLIDPNLGLIDPNIDLNFIPETGNVVGSLVGELGNIQGGTITNCYVEGGSASGNNYVGGLVGQNSLDGTITNCYSSGNVSSVNGVGGLVGKNLGTIKSCYSSGDVFLASDTASLPGGGGGLVGGNYGTISNCYAAGSVSVSGTERWRPVVVGGLVGRQDGDGTIINCYATGSVSGGGGLVGSNNGNLYNSFWDIETSGQTTSAGGTGKTTAEMQMESTFTEAGWDFVGESVNGTEDIWWILEGQNYPRLWWQLLAFSPDPDNGAVNVNQRLILSWFAGASAMHHDIYFGEDEEAVANATTESTGIYRGRQLGEARSYAPGALEWDKTYYWRIDEVNEADPNSPWKGNIWSFTIVKFLVVDDFESYNDLNPDEPNSNRIFNMWIDGYENPATNGSIVGYDVHPFCEQTIVHGGFQSMPYFYDNSGPANYSEATANIGNLVIDRDWTKYGATVLSLWFHGGPANAAEPMYVAISNDNGPTAVVDNPDAALIETWTEWTIELQEFAVQGVNLANVDTISIGFGDKNPDVSGQPGGSGLVFFDDIRLYRPPEPEP